MMTWMTLLSSTSSQSNLQLRHRPSSIDLFLRNSRELYLA